MASFPTATVTTGAGRGSGRGTAGGGEGATAFSGSGASGEFEGTGSGNISLPGLATGSPALTGSPSFCTCAVPDGVAGGLLATVPLRNSSRLSPARATVRITTTNAIHRHFEPASCKTDGVGDTAMTGCSSAIGVRGGSGRYIECGGTTGADR